MPVRVSSALQTDLHALSRCGMTTQRVLGERTTRPPRSVAAVHSHLRNLLQKSKIKALDRASLLSSTLRIEVDSASGRNTEEDHRQSAKGVQVELVCRERNETGR